MDTKTTAQRAQQNVGLAEASPGYLDAETGKAAIKRARDAFRIKFGQRCRAARGSMEISQVADRLGVHRNTIWNIERGDSLPDAFELDLLAAAYGTTAERLLHGGDDAQEQATEEQGLPNAVHAVPHGRFVYVPHFDVTASAGKGDLFNDLESVKAMRPFDQSYIRGELGLAHDELGLISVFGNSMEPRLASGDTVLVDLRAGYEMFTDGIHVVRLDESLLVKQVQRLPGKVFRIRSLNPDYEPFDIKTSEEADRDFAIIGRVRWGGVTIK